MTNISNVMKVTDICLSAISSILIDTFVYNGDIDIQGSVIVSNEGIASRFEPLSYLQKTDLSFMGITIVQNSSTHDYEPEDHPVRVSITGNFMTSEDSGSTAFSLHGDNDSLAVILSSTTATILYNSEIIAKISNFSLVMGTTVTVNLYINSRQIGLEIIANGETHSSYVDVNNFDIKNFSSVLVGLDTLESENYWKGSIDLTKFFIYEDENTLYSPTVKENIKFTSIVISEPNYNITDTTTSFIHRAYEIPIEEVSRTNNHVLLRATIPSKTYLTIGNIGLFCEVSGTRRLFSLITGLNLKKNSDLTYNLIFHINTNINLVNTKVLPEIILKEFSYADKTALEDIRKAFVNSNVDLERVIQHNADVIGLNSAQVFYREQQQNKFTEDNWLKTSAYLRCNPKPSAFFSFIHNTLNSYKVTNLANFNSINSLEVLDESFKGYGDTIDFNGNKTLCLNLTIPDFQDKILIAKKDIENEETYFVLSIENSNLVFLFYTEDEFYRLRIPVVPTEYYKFLNPFLLSIVQETSETSTTFTVYHDTEILGTLQIQNPAFVSLTEDFSLMNYTNDLNINNAKIYLQDVLFFQKALTKSDLYNLGILFVN